MLDNKKLVEVLIGQHRNLEKILGLAAEELKKENPDGGAIVATLGNFKENLLEHLKLENENFYPALLADMEAKGQNTEKTQQFIDEMGVIGEKVTGFLGSYAAKEVIEENIDKFREDFQLIVGTLSIRIESEENGVFAYWG